MSHNRSSIWTGSLLIIIGALFLAANLLEIGWSKIWPLLLFAGAGVNVVIFLADRRNFGVLMPASILLIYGLLFQYCVMTDWRHISELWPTFILGPGVGFLLMYVFGNRDRGLLIPAFILIGLATIFYITLGPLQRYGRYWPALLIIAGIILLLLRPKQQAT